MFLMLGLSRFRYRKNKAKANRRVDLSNVGLGTQTGGTEPMFIVKAKFDHKPEEEGELEFKRGDRIIVTREDPSGWWIGK